MTRSTRRACVIALVALAAVGLSAPVAAVPAGKDLASSPLDGFRSDRFVCTVINKDDVLVHANITLKGADGTVLAANGGGAMVMPGATTSLSYTVPFGPPLLAWCHVEVGPADSVVFGEFRVNDPGGATLTSSKLEVDLHAKIQEIKDLLAP